MCSEHVNDWKYFSLGDLEENEGFPKGKSCALPFNYGHVTCQNKGNWRIGGEFTFFGINKLAFLKEDKHT